MKRSKHSLSNTKLLSADMGTLIPVGCYEVLPGDSVRQATSLLVRVSPLVAPVMHPVSVRVHHWFVPYRLVWSGWEDFITGGSDGEGDGAVFPTITVNTGTGWAVGSLADYFGIPTGVDDIPVSALPFRAYNKIFNEFYRDEDLVTERAVSTAGGADATTATTVASVAWEKDYFTSARPWPQKGPEVTLPLGDRAPVSGLGVAPAATFPNAGVTVKDASTTAAGVAYAQSNTSAASALIYRGSAAGASGIPDIYADLSQATAVDVNTVRLAFALQRYQEARAQYGSRYTEYLRYLGVRSSDARLQRPEYLGGGKQTIAFSEVLQTAPTTSGNVAGVADLKGHGIAAVRSRRFVRFFEEHGVVISLLSVRPKTMYANGLPRMWSRTTKEDFWQKELEHIGQQEVLNKEIYAGAASPTGVFGYQDRYAEYRHIQSSIAGEFRSTLNYWHMARLFAAEPALNSAFVTADPTTRIYASTATDPLYIMAAHSIQARRLVSKSTIGRIL